MEIFGIEAISGLSFIFEQKEFSSFRHLIVSDTKSLEKLKAFLRFKPPSIPWYDLPPFPVSKSPYSETSFRKRRKWQSWASFSEGGSAIFLASPQALLKKTSGNKKGLVLREGGLFNPSLLRNYREKAYVEREGDFALRGFLADVFSPAYDCPLRLELRGDKIHSIHLLDEEFKRRKNVLSQAFISPLYEWDQTGEGGKKLCDYLRAEGSRLKFSLPLDLFQAISRGKPPFGFECLLSCLSDTCSLDYFDVSPLVWFFRPEKSQEEFFEVRDRWASESPFQTKGNLFLDWDRIEPQTAKKPIELSDGGSILSSLSTKGSDLSSQTKRIRKDQEIKTLPRLFINFPDKGKELSTSDKGSIKSQTGGIKENQGVKTFPGLNFLQKDFSSILFKKSKSLKEDLKKLPVDHIVWTGSDIQTLKNFLQKQGIMKERIEFFEGKNLIFLDKTLRESFFIPRLPSLLDGTAFLRAEDFIEKKKLASNPFDFFRQKARALEFSQLEMGDLLVHRQHGIGEFAGLQSLKLRDSREDFIVLHYRDGDKLFVPAYRAAQVKRYSRKRSLGVTKSLLDRLGYIKPWERKKAKAKKHIHSLALELLELYRFKKQKKRKPFKPVQHELKQFAEEFPYKETPDQQRAILEIMSDMDKDQPMDRLLTADTGFGKTEVALRAAFRALSNGLQVCFLAPTTVLSLQHFENFKQRFKNTPFKLGLLNRFSKADKLNIFKQAASGELDLLISTHSVFNPRLSFKRLGLLILDEEHRFGVRQKEKLFRFRKSLDVLSLSATPIPRTLNMALSGIKDISLISHPPKGRIAPRIILKSWSDGLDNLIVDACQKEKARGGQTLFVHNRVKSLERMAEYLQRLLPDFKIAVARGGMDNMDKIMLDFFQKKYDMLLSTNIIESGMDIPQANTLFINRVHEMGLSQIYQLKGRVGRGRENSFCYLLFPDKSTLSPLTLERLDLLEKYAGLGSAYQLALRDLENRGAGSLFGSEQSGHLQSLGEDLYFELLNEELKSSSKPLIEPEILLPFSAGIPSSYIPDSRLRLLYYKNLSSAEEKTREAVRQEMLEEFGPFPKELSQLFFLLKVRDLCKELLIKDLRAGYQKADLTFDPSTPIPSEKILSALENRGGQMTSDRSLKVPLSEEGFSKELEQFLMELKKSAS